MKRFIEVIWNAIHQFIDSKQVQEPPVRLDSILRTIDLAMRKSAGVHVIFSNKSFTGDIVKYDQERQQLIVKNFEKNISTIIRISDIKRISMVPATISRAQKSKL